MTPLTTIAAIAALLGSAVIAGVFFAFSSFIMKALARVPTAEGIAAMQSINVVVLNPSFLGVFIGTAVVSALVGALALASWGTASAWLLLAGAALYVAGTFLVTALGNVPLNNRLAAVSATDPDAAGPWRHYLARWTALNTFRTAAAAAAALMFTLGLM